MIGERVSSEGVSNREGVSREITILNLYLKIAITPPISRRGSCRLFQSF